MTLAELNACDHDRFTDALGWIFEESPWVAERAWHRRPFASIADLHAAMTAVVDAAPIDERLALLRSHPDLGVRARMSDASVGEQRGAGLDALAADQRERLRTLNDAYRSRFGFPFILAVKGATVRDILLALERRVANDSAEEIGEAIRQVHRIAMFRLQDFVT